MLDDVVEFVGEENVVQVITNNAAAFNAIGDLLMTKKRSSCIVPNLLPIALI